MSFDVAEVHDLAAGGSFDILSEGAFPYAEADSLDIAGAAAYITNKITATVDGTQAAEARERFLAKRSIVQSDCSGSRLTATRTALSNCRTLALAAQSAAASGSASKFQEYYKSTAASTRSTVAAVFGRVATECGSTSSGVARYYCSDVYGACDPGVLAYTLPSQSYMVNCPLYFSDLSALSRTCHDQDQATTTLHEMTHLSQIKGTTDQNGAYGYAAVRALTAAQNLNHADTYTLYAQGKSFKVFEILKKCRMLIHHSFVRRLLSAISQFKKQVCFGIIKFHWIFGSAWTKRTLRLGSTLGWKVEVAILGHVDISSVA